jgi:DNA-binding SARP family transcriptional activator
VGIAVLGPLRIDEGGVSLAPRDRVVLAALTVFFREEVSAERLADALWGDQPPASWGKVVPGCVMRLRKVLGANAIETTPCGYRLVIGVDEVDTRRFERLVERGHELLGVGEPDRAAHLFGEALALWRGRALTDVEDWGPGRIEAGRLDELRLDTEEALLEARLRAGQHWEVLAEARARVGEAPLRERRWALLAHAQYRAGRQAEALSSLRRARMILVT